MEGILSSGSTFIFSQNQFIIGEVQAFSSYHPEQKHVVHLYGSMHTLYLGDNVNGLQSTRFSFKMWLASNPGAGGGGVVS